jgi:2,3-bisphosphoglycerate-independent phosphoglycerate mutase
MSKKVILVIMDGWGLGQVAKADAIQNAHVPFVSSLYQQYPNTTLVTCGEEVGLPEGQMGNSEVGHLNLGAGRIVYQELQRINVAIKTGEFASHPTLLQSIRYAKENNKPLHLIGLVSDGGVHAHTAHLKALCDLCKTEGLTNVFIHAVTDGRDTDPKSGLKLVFKFVTYKNSVKKLIEFSLKRSRKTNSERNKKRSSVRKTKLKTIEIGIKLK